jgi:hypothetical protein
MLRKMGATKPRAFWIDAMLVTKNAVKQETISKFWLSSNKGTKSDIAGNENGLSG